MHKTICSLAFLLLTTTHLFSQNLATDQPRFIDNVRFGGSINIGFGNNYSFFAIAPGAIYDFSESFSAGLNVRYMYYKNKSAIQRTTNLYGGRVLALLRPASSIQLSAEYEQLRLSDKQVFQDAVSKWQPALFIGAEYVTGNFSMGLRYDILYEKTNVIYSSALSPVFRVYF